MWLLRGRSPDVLWLLGGRSLSVLWLLGRRSPDVMWLLGGRSPGVDRRRQHGRFDVGGDGRCRRERSRRPDVPLTEVQAQSKLQIRSV